MNRKNFGRAAFVGSLSIGGLVAAACGPPAQVSAMLCGQTQDGKVVVALDSAAMNCTAGPGQIRIIVQERCGPLMEGSNAVDDCWRGSLAKTDARGAVWGPGVYRLGSFNQPGDQTDRLVASDATGG